MARLRRQRDYSVPEALLDFDPAVWPDAATWIKAREKWLKDNGFPEARPGQDDDTPFGRVGDRFAANHLARLAATMAATAS